jgi:chromosome segregation ATPase
MGSVAAKFAGIDELKQDVEDLKKAAELMRGVNGHLEGKGKMINDSFEQLVKAKAYLDSQIGSMMGTLNSATSQTKALKEKVIEVEAQVEDVRRKLAQAKKGMELAQQAKSGDYMGALNNAADNFGVKVPNFGGGGGGGKGFGGFGF